MHVRTIRKYMTRFDIETRKPAGEYHWLYGKARSEEAKQAISETMAGRDFSKKTQEKSSAAQRGQSLGPSTRKKIANTLSRRRLPPETRRLMSEATAGERNPNWRGSYSDRYGAGWTYARECVRERDKYISTAERMEPRVNLTFTTSFLYAHSERTQNKS